MALVKTKPTSAGRRSMVKVVNADLHKGAPYAPLVEALHKRAGRNSMGNITTRHQGGGHKHHYRIVDFRRDKDGIPAKVERLEYDPNRSANIALLCYADGERRYMIAPKGIVVGQKVEAGAEAPALRPSCPPRPGLSSTLCTSEPIGMLRSGSALPDLIGASAPDMTASPAPRPFGARM